MIIKQELGLRKAQLGTQYNPLVGVFGEGSLTRLPVDGDGRLERFGYFLFFENKQPGETITEGHLRMLCELALLNPEKVQVLICVLDGTKCPDTKANLFIPTAYVKLAGHEWRTWKKDEKGTFPIQNTKPSSLNAFKVLLKAWWDDASRRGRK